MADVQSRPPRITLDSLPAEILRLIVQHIATVPSFDLGYKPSSVSEKFYVNFSQWNEINQRQTLFNLAHTCKRLETIVYECVCQNLALYGSVHYSSFELFESAPFGPNIHASNVWAAPFVSQLLFVTHYKSLPRSAMKHVRTLCLSTANTPYQPWLFELASEMTSLEDVLLELVGFPRSIANIAFMFDVVAKHKNRPRVHVNFEMLCDESASAWGFSELLKMFESEWAQFKALKVVTLALTVANENLRYPESFFDMIKGFKSLKNLCYYDVNFDLIDLHDARLNGLRSLPTAAQEVFKDLPNLENLGFTARVPYFELPPNSRVSRLRMTINTFTPFNNSYEMFDRVTHLTIDHGDKGELVFPKFRNLTTLSLKLKDSRGEQLLEHFVACNPRLVNLYLALAHFSNTLLKRVLVNIQRLYITDAGTNTLEDILSFSPKQLCELFVSFDRVSMAKALSLDWVVDAVVAGDVISPNLEKIQVSLLSVGYGTHQGELEMVIFFLSACSVQSRLDFRFPYEAKQEIIVPVCSRAEHQKGLFIIDLKAMAKWVPLRRMVPM